MAGLSGFFKAEQDRKRKLFKREGYPESAAARAKDKADTGGRTNAKAEAEAEVKTKARAEPPPKKAKFGVGPSKTIMHKGRSMANVTGDQLKKTGLKSTAAYMRRWKELGKRPTKATTTANVTIVKPAVSGTKVVTPEARTTTPPPPPLNAAEAREKAKAKQLRDARVAAMKLAEGNPATRRGPPMVDPQANPNTRRGPAPPPTPAEVARLKRVAEMELAEANPATRRGTRNLGGSTRAAEIERAEKDPATRRGTSRDNFQSKVDRAKRTGNQFVLLPEMLLKKGGVVKAPKKSIDGIASKGKTRAKHR